MNNKLKLTIIALSMICLVTTVSTAISQTYADPKPDKPVKSYCYLSGQNIVCFTTKDLCDANREAQTEDTTKCRSY